VLIRLTEEALNGQIALVEVVDGLTEEASFAPASASTSSASSQSRGVQLLPALFTKPGVHTLGDRAEADGYAYEPRHPIA
jgi:hypothetical protein